MIKKQKITVKILISNIMLLIANTDNARSKNIPDA